MKRALLIIFWVASTCPWLAAADSPWQYGRIVDIKKSVSSYTKAWVANTPISEERTVYTISVHVQDKIMIGNYDVSAEQPEPPPDWITSYPLKIQVAGDTLYIRSLTGNLHLHVTQRKNAPRPMQPLTMEEKKRLEELEAPAESLIGFSEGNSKAANSKSSAQEPAPQPPPPPPAPTTGAVNVRSTPYLSEVFVDGDSMGYTPAKIALAPGKHTFRVEKPGYKVWTKEITITVGSELTLDVTLERK